MTPDNLRPIPDLPHYYADINGDIWSTQPKGSSKTPSLPKKLSQYPVGSAYCLSVKVSLPCGRKKSLSAARLFHKAFPEILRVRKKPCYFKGPCKFNPCDRKEKVKGYCLKHYTYVKRNSA